MNEVIETLVNLIPTTKRGYLKFGIFILILFIIGTKLRSQDNIVPEPEVILPEVEIVTLRELSSTKNFITAGTVEAVSEAFLKAESSGQVTTVKTDLGKFVQAGSIIATIENSAQYASLLQAEGAYESALANAATGDVGVREAEIRLANATKALVSASMASYGTAQTILFNNIDPFFANPDGLYPSLKVPSDKDGDFLRAERLAFQKYLPTWQSFSYEGDSEEVTANVAFANEKINTMIAIVDSLINAVNHFSNEKRFTDSEKTANNLLLSSGRTQLLTAQSSLTESTTALKVAKENLDRALISATSVGVSFSDAQLKQSLGVLKSAQSNYEKTLVRSPISGVVNALYVKKGDYASTGQDIALVANNGSLQVTTSVSETDVANIIIGQEVIIDGNATGSVGAIGGAVDPKTGKVAIKINLSSTNSLTNGTAVKVLFAGNDKVLVDKENNLLVPLSAVKLTASGASLYVLNEDSTLSALLVELGQVSGDAVEILSGASFETSIVRDVRGRKVGEKVTVSSK